MNAAELLAIEPGWRMPGDVDRRIQAAGPAGLCPQCGAVVPDRRHLYCSVDCRRRYYAARARIRRALIADAKKQIAAAVAVLMTEGYHYDYLIRWRLHVVYHAWGHNDQRPYGYYDWTEVFHGAFPRRSSR